MCDGEAGARREVDGDLAGIASALERFSRRPRVGRPGEVIREEMIEWRRLIDRMELEFAGMVTELAACDEDEWDGCTSPIGWVTEECHTTGTAAWNALVVGQQAARLPESARALVAGEIGFGHLALIASTAEWIGGLPVPADAASPGGAPLPGFDEAVLLGKARTRSVAELRRECAHLRHAADPRRFLTEQVEQVEARCLELKACEGGALFLRGFLDTEGGATLRAALEPLARPAGEGDGRTRARRFADALVELGGPLPAETARRLGCDAAVTRVVFGADSAVLDVGRATRVPATATRRALLARDRGCVWPGCHRPASWGEIHHSIPRAASAGGADRGAPQRGQPGPREDW